MDPLARLRDLHLPPPPDVWPPAPGWWILGGLCLALTGAALWLFCRRRGAGRYRREALAEARQLVNHEDMALTDVVQLIRRTAISGNPSTPLASMSGAAVFRVVDDFAGGQMSRCLGTGNDPGTIEAMLYGDRIGTLTPEQKACIGRSVGRWIRKHRRRDLC